MNKNRKGFTLVELVIVIAVIAILAGVMIATFANVVNKANESRKLQEEEQARLQQLVEDAMAKVDNENWLGREDFENILAEKLANINVELNGELNQSEVKAAVAAALNEFGAAKAGENTGLTDSQLETIVSRVLSGTLTASQVEAIVKNYGSSLSATSVRNIVDAAIEAKLSPAQIAAAVQEAISTDKTIAQIVADVKNIKDSTVDKDTIKEIVEEIVKKYSNAQALTADASNFEEKLAEALAVPGSVLTLTEDVTLKTALKIDSAEFASFTLDLGGKTLTVGSDPIAVGAKVTLNIKNGTLTGDGRLLQSAGNVVIESGTYKGGVGTAAAIYASAGVLTINDGTFSADVYLIYAGGASTVVINGGTFNVGIVVSNNAGVAENAKSMAIINDGTFKATSDACLIYWPTGTLTINGGSFTAEASVLAVAGGTVSVTGGTLATTGNVVDGDTSGTFSTADTIAVLASRSSSYKLNGVTVTSGATLTSANGKTIGVYGTVKAGGTFTEATEEQLKLVVVK